MHALKSQVPQVYSQLPWQLFTQEPQLFQHVFSFVAHPDSWSVGQCPCTVPASGTSPAVENESTRNWSTWSLSLLMGTSMQM